MWKDENAHRLLLISLVLVRGCLFIHNNRHCALNISVLTKFPVVKLDLAMGFIYLVIFFSFAGIWLNKCLLAFSIFDVHNFHGIMQTPATFEMLLSLLLYECVYMCISHRIMVCLVKIGIDVVRNSA